MSKFSQFFWLIIYFIVADVVAVLVLAQFLPFVRESLRIGISVGIVASFALIIQKKLAQWGQNNNNSNRDDE